MKEKHAIFPGTFDPITLGHINLLEKAVRIFDKVSVAVGINTTKSHYFPHNDRVEMIKACSKDFVNVEVISYQGITVEFCKKIGADFILRGVRNSLDFEYERAIMDMNKKMAPGIDTILFVTDPVYASISSTIVREIIKTGGDISQFVPKEVLEYLGNRGVKEA